MSGDVVNKTDRLTPYTFIFKIHLIIQYTVHFQNFINK
jgi:hypothetical protein